MIISCIILDDEEFAIEHLMTYIVKIPFLVVVGQFTDPSAAISFLESHSVDLVFLDIEMPNFSIGGLDFVRIVGDRIGYIFTTAYPNYALQSYDYNAIDFLHKPISFERFTKAVQKARLVLNLQTDQPEETFIYVQLGNQYQQVNFEDICWIESERNYVSIYTEKGRLNAKLSISELEAQLPKKQFVRIHKSFIVARTKIDLIGTTQVTVMRNAKPKAIPLGGEVYRKPLLETVTLKRRK